MNRKYKKKHFGRAIALFFLVFCVTLVFSQSFEKNNPKVIKVACVGNSITYGMKLENRELDSYPSVLQRLLGKGYEVGNFGKNGATLLFKGHNPYIEQQEFRQALKFHPDILVIHLGINDTDPRDYPQYGDEFFKDYLSLLDSFKTENPNLRIIIANLSPIHSSHYRYKSGTRAWRDSIRSLIPRIAKASGAELIDFGDCLRDHPNLVPDGIHPDKEGALLLAQEVFSAITGNYGGLRMAPVYGDRMVLQRYKPLKIQGKANSKDSIFLSLNGKAYSTESDSRGHWQILIPPMAEATGLEMTVTDKNDTLKFRDIAIGEVWLASGQSNMEFRMKYTPTWDEDKTITSDSLLRLYNMMPVAFTDAILWNDSIIQLMDELKHFKDTSWEYSTQGSSKDFSAVAWYFGKMLRDSLNIPVGIINNAVGGAPAESWIDIESLEHDIPEILVDWRTNDYLQPWVQKRVEENLGEENDTLSHRHPYEPSYLFSSGIRPLGKYPLTGVIWYQGESNAHNIEIHETLFQSLLRSWRNNWDNPEMPFIFVQLSSIDRPSWPTFRDSQRKLAESNRNVWMAVSSDHGDSLDVHPPRKKPIGERLGRQALNHVYSFGNIIPQGPTIREALKTQGGDIILDFDYAEGLKTSDGEAPYKFEVSGIDGVFNTPESVKIVDNKIIIKGIEADPEFVRYGWEPFTRSNLVNGENLPASTFKINITPMKDYTIEEGFESGLSGSFTGKINNKLIVAGGCNFPNNPMSPDSKKKFYKGIYCGEKRKGNWEFERIASLPVPIAYGAAVSVPDGVIMIGGSNEEGSLKDVYKLTKNEEDEFIIEDYPTLPQSVDNAYATFIDGKVYLVGGNVDGIPSNSVLFLDTKDLRKGWQEIKNFPGNPRVQPVASGYKNDKGETYLYIWGGFAPKGENHEATLNTDGLRYDVKKEKWAIVPAPKNSEGEAISLGGGMLVTLEDGRMVAAGGVNKDIFLEALRNQAPDYLTHPVEWYKFNPYILVFYPENETWETIATTEKTARAGAGMVVVDKNKIIVTGGELKPRIRTSEIFETTI